MGKVFDGAVNNFIELLKPYIDGNEEVPVEYIYYLVGLNVFTILLFVYSVYRVQTAMNKADELDKYSDGSGAESDDDHTSSSEEESSEKAPMVPPQAMRRKGLKARQA
uniref:Protein MANBAL n=1 Tax=Panagrellus redivivus TaxID=6233 RepID=A0A7E4ZXZ7_PANRE